MKRRTTLAGFGAIMAFSALAGAAFAQSSPVVVELYTSQGCSSCPPADAYLAKLAEQPNVITLALHVDYWDYIGWKDEFASPAFSKRQKSYARAAGRDMVYTPQMIIGGTEDVAGHRPREVEQAVTEAASEKSPVKLETSRAGDTLDIRLHADRPLERRVVIQIVRYIPHSRVEIRSGENAGRTIDYSNIVTGWRSVSAWDGQNDAVLHVRYSGQDPGVVIVQEDGFRGILASARLR